MNLAQMLAERMKSPGAMADFKDRTSNPQAIAGVGDAVTGSDKQEPYPLDAEAMGESDADGGDSGGAAPGDVGLGMLEHAHAGAIGAKSKATFKKALDHAHAKHAKHKAHHKKK